MDDKLEGEGGSSGQSACATAAVGINQNLFLQRHRPSTFHQPRMIYQTIPPEKPANLSKSYALFIAISLDSRCSSQFICISFSSTQDSQRLHKGFNFNHMPGHHDQHDSASTWKGHKWFALTACSCTSCEPHLISLVQTQTRKMLTTLGDLCFIYASREKRRSKATASCLCDGFSTAFRCDITVFQRCLSMRWMTLLPGLLQLHGFYPGFKSLQIMPQLTPSTGEESSVLHKLMAELWDLVTFCKQPQYGEKKLVSWTLYNQVTLCVQCKVSELLHVSVSPYFKWSWCHFFSPNQCLQSLTVVWDAQP